MKKLLRKINYQTVIVFIVVLFAVIIRIYNFSNRLIYGPEQARSLLVASLNIIDKPSLLGQEYFRFTSEGHKLFYSATFTYFLVPFLIIFKNNILYVTFIFTLLNVATGLVTYFVSYKIFNRSVAFFSLVVFLFNSYMIYHSLFLWPYNFLPLFGILSVYLVYLIKQKQSLSYVFWLGVISGLGFGIQYLYAVYILFLLLALVIVSNKKLKHLSLLIVGGVIGDLPMVLFDLRHNFYNFNTAFHYLLDTFLRRSDASFNYYYLLPLWAIGALVAGFFLYKVFKKSKVLGIILLFIYLLFNLNSSLINFKKSLGMPEGLKWNDYVKVSKTIADDNPKNFNVVTLFDFDTRAYVLRFPLEAIYHVKPMDVEEYPKANVIYVFARNDYDITHPKVWELQVFAPFKVKVLQKVKDNYVLYRLNK